jgi:hypothetical protein
MALSDKQKKVLAFCQANGGKITKQQAMSIIDTSYRNGEKYVGEVLSRMVNAGLLIREKPGHFKIGKMGKSKATGAENQTTLF